MFRKKKRTYLIVPIFILVFALVKFMLGRNNNVQQLYSTLGETYYFFKAPVTDFMNNFRLNESVTEENRNLKKEIKMYQLIIQDYEKLELENKNLKKLISIKSPKDYKKIVSYIIAKSPDIWHKQVIVNVGTEDGVKIKDPAISEWGLVGKVINVSKNTATIELITDSLSWVSCLNTRSGDTGVLSGLNNNEGELKYLLEKVDFKKSDLLLTSGSGNVYPKGIPVGVVSFSRKSSDSVIPIVQAEFLTDFKKLEKVIVLVK